MAGNVVQEHSLMIISALQQHISRSWGGPSNERSSPPEVCMCFRRRHQPCRAFRLPRMRLQPLHRTALMSALRL